MRGKSFLNIGYKIGLVILLLIFFILTLFFLERAFNCVFYPYQLDYGEGALLNQINELLDGNTIYPPLEDYPFIQGNYPPLYHLISIPGILFTGPSFLWPRLVSVLSTLIIAGVLGLIIKEITGNKYLSIITGFLYLSLKYVFIWAPWARVDMLGVMFAVLGVYWVLKNHDNHNLFWADIFFLLGVYTKHSLFAAPLAAYIWLLVKNKNKGIKHLKYFLGTGFLFFVLLTLITKGEFFNHLVLYNMDEFSWQTVNHFMEDQLDLYLILYVFGGAGALLSIIKEKRWLIPLYLLTSFLFSLTIGKVGSSYNYLVEFYAVLSLTSVLFLHYMYNIEHKIAKTFALILIILFIAQGISWYHNPYGEDWIFTPDLSQNHPQQKEVHNIVKNTEGPIISEDMGLLALNNKKVLFEPFEFTQLVKQGYWNQDKLLKDIKEGKFKLIIINFNINRPGWRLSRFNQSFLKALKYNYSITNIKGKYRIYKPAPDPEEISF